MLQVFGRLARVIGDKKQRSLLLYQSMYKTIGARNQLIVMQDDAVDIADHTLSFIAQAFLLGCQS